MTKAEKDKKTRRKIFIVVLVLIFVMLFSTAGYSFMNGDKGGDTNSNIVEHNGVKFYKNDQGYWQFSFNGNNYMTQYNPLELNGTKVSTSLSINGYKKVPLYIVGTQEPELLRNIGQFSQRVSYACLSENCSGDFPIKNCSSDKIISVEEPEKNEQEGIQVDENCVFIVANYSNQAKYSDAFLFKIIGI